MGKLSDLIKKFLFFIGTEKKEPPLQSIEECIEALKQLSDLLEGFLPQCAEDETRQAAIRLKIQDIRQEKENLLEFWEYCDPTSLRVKKMETSANQLLAMFRKDTATLMGGLEAIPAE